MPDDPRPNLLLITTDQQRHDTLGDRAPSFLRTPHLDDLARQGVTFSRCYAECPMCVPSRVSIMSGRHAASTGHNNFRASHDTLAGLPTMPGLLRDAGYQTIAVGKMHFGPQRARHGFEEMVLPDDYYRHMRRSGHALQPMRHGLGQNEMHPGLSTVPESMTQTSWCAEQALEFIKHRRDPTRPFFMWLSFGKPHPPLDPPEPYYSMYRDCEIPEPIIGDWSRDDRCPYPFLEHRQNWSLDKLSPETIRAARAAYYGLITQCDYNIGRVLAALQDHGRDFMANTMIVFTSDHGEYLGDHRTASKFFWHEPSAHVPMFVRPPAGWDRQRIGTTCDALVNLSDILPTLVNAGGGHTPDGIDGHDLLATASNNLPPRETLIGVGMGDPPKYFAAIDDRYKFIHYVVGGAQQLFDLKQDPDERHDLIESPEAQPIVARLSQAIIDGLKGSPLVGGTMEALPTQPVPHETEAERRSRSWPGYHTDEFAADVRH